MLKRKKTISKPPTETDSLYLNKLKFDPKQLSSPIHFLLKNTRLLFLMILVLVTAGVGAYFTLPRELNPEVNIPIVNVVTTLPGADPLDVESLITKELEQEIENITTISNMTSSSTDSLSVVTIEFNSNVDPEKALADVKEKVDLVNDLPDDASDPRVTKLDFNDQAVWQVALVSEADQRSLSMVAKDLQDQLEKTTGIRQVSLSGDLEEEIVISLKSEALVEHNLSVDQITQAIQGSDLTLPAGSLSINQTTYKLSLDNEITSIEQLRRLPISLGTQSIKLEEISDIYFQAKDSDRLTTYRHQDGVQKRAIQLDIFKTNTETISGAVESAQTVIDQTLEKYPQVELVSIIDFSQQIDDQFVELGSNFRDTVLLVFLVLFLFLGFRQASIASISIPLTFLSTFAIMSMSGISINFLSLFSLLLSLGLVVDDAIVIVQAMHRYTQKFNPTQAGLMVFRDFVVPIWTTTLTTVWAFLPLLLASGIIGEFIKSIPVVVTATLMSSTTIAVLINLPLTVLFAQLKMPKRVKFLLIGLGFLASLIVLGMIGANSPLLAVLIMCWLVLLGLLVISRQQVLTLSKQQTTKVSKKYPQIIAWINWFKQKQLTEKGLLDFGLVAQKYRNFLRKILVSKKRRFQVYGIAIGFFILSISFLVTGLLKTEFFPATDEETLYVDVIGPTGWPVENTAALTKEIEQKILETPEVRYVITQTGAATPTGFGASGQGSHVGYLTLALAKTEDRTKTSSQVADDIRQKISHDPRATINVVEVSGGPPAGADLQVNIKGDDLETLEKISNDFMATLESMPEAINVDTSLKQSAGQINVRLNETELRERGLTAGQIGSWLRTAVTGSETGEILVAGEEIDVVTRLNESQKTLSMLQNLQLPTQIGSYTLAEVADFTLETSPTSIEREGGIRVVRVTAAVNGISATELLQKFEENNKNYSIPRGYTWDVGGVNEENNKSVQSIIQAMGLSALLILITMVLQLNSFRKSLLVLSVIPLAVAGVFFNFTILGIPLSFPALIGVLALFGIVVNNSIMLVEKINQNIKFGLPFLESVIDACASRIEAIFFTSVTTAIGLLPITVSDPLWRGLGGAIIAGLTVSGTLILVILPALFVDVFGKEAKNSK